MSFFKLSCSKLPTSKFLPANLVSLKNLRFQPRVLTRLIKIVALNILALFIASQAMAELRVVTTFTVIADMARNVGGEYVQVDSITKPGSDIHTYQPTPRDLIAAQKADLILWNGLNLELWFEQFFANLDGVPSATVSTGVAPISIGEGPYSGKPNPHAWMSASDAQIYVENIRDAFAQHDPDNAAIYAQNSEDYIAQMQETVAEARKSIDALPEEDRWLVSSEGAFSYLARDFGLKELFLWPINADQQGTPQQVRHVIDTVRANNIKAVFSESTVSADPALQVSRETGAHYGGIIYVDSLTGPEGPAPTFLDLLKVTSNTIAKGLTH